MDKTTIAFLAGLLCLISGLLSGLVEAIKIAIKGTEVEMRPAAPHAAKTGKWLGSAILRFVLVVVGLSLMYPLVSGLYTGSAGAGILNTIQTGGDNDVHIWWGRPTDDGRREWELYFIAVDPNDHSNDGRIERIHHNQDGSVDRKQEEMIIFTVNGGNPPWK